MSAFPPLSDAQRVMLLAKGTNEASGRARARRRTMAAFTTEELQAEIERRRLDGPNEQVSAQR